MYTWAITNHLIQSVTAIKSNKMIKTFLKNKKQIWWVIKKKKMKEKHKNIKNKIADPENSPLAYNVNKIT